MNFQRRPLSNALRQAEQMAPLRRSRHRRCWTLEQAGEALGVTGQTLARYETKTTPPLVVSLRAVNVFPELALVDLIHHPEEEK